MVGPEALLETARTACAQGRYAEAFAIYERLLQSDANKVATLLDYARAKYREFDDLQQATELFERASGLDSSNVELLLWLGDLYGMGYGRGYAAAAANYRRAIELAPTNADAYIGLGLLHRAPKAGITLTEAISSFRRATQEEPNRSDAHLDLGVALIEAKDVVPARDELQTALRLFARAGKQRQAKAVGALLDRLDQGKPMTGVGYSLESSRYRWPNAN